MHSGLLFGLETAETGSFCPHYFFGKSFTLIDYFHTFYVTIIDSCSAFQQSLQIQERENGANFTHTPYAIFKPPYTVW
jgi:hypothetical protein